MSVFKDTAPSKFAWASTSRALEFSRALSEVMIASHHPNDSEDDEFERVVNKRIGSVLTVLHDFSPVKLATIWKLNGRARQGSLIAATKEYEEHLNPTNDDVRREFVCRFDESHLGAILERFEQKRSAVDGSSRRGIVYIEDIAELENRQRFVPPEHIRALGLKKMLAIPFDRENGGIVAPGQFPDFLLNLYTSDVNGGAKFPHAA